MLNVTYRERVFIDKYGYCEVKDIKIIFDGDSRPHSFDSDYFFDKSSKTYCRIGSKSLSFREILNLAIFKKIYEINNQFKNKDFCINEFGSFSQNAIFKFTTFELADHLGK